MGLHQNRYRTRRAQRHEPMALALTLCLVAAARGLKLPSSGQASSDDSFQAHARRWEGLAPLEASALLQGSHWGALGPEPGYYQGNTPPVPRLGLPALKMQDGSSGFRTTEPGTEGTTTQWPCPLSLAATFDEELVGRVAAAMGAEFRGKGANVMLGPSVDVQRVAQGGRSFELLSGEDPHLGAVLAGAFVRGVQSQGVMCAVKHFAFTQQETNRLSAAVQVDERTAWELYYPPFEAAVQAGVGAVICGTHKVNGTFACHNRALLQRDLRGAMGFQGMVLSQIGAVRGVDALGAGVDIEVPGRTAWSQGVFRPEVLAEAEPVQLHIASVHVRQAVFSVGLDSSPGCVPPFCALELRSDQRSTEHNQLAREAAMAAVTLLKNDGLLPLNLNRLQKLAILGSASFKVGEGPLQADYYGGGGSNHVHQKDMISTVLGALKERAKWTSDCEILVIPGASNAEAMTRLGDVADADAIVVVGAATSAEGADRASLSLDDNADRLIAAVGQLKKPTVVLMQTPGAVLTPWRQMPHVRAIANIFLGGEQTGRALAGLVLGDFSPSGKLPVAFPASPGDAILPSRQPRVVYSEGLLTSYRAEVPAAFPFGHGLSYTQFRLGAPRQVRCAAANATNENSSACVAVNVTNTGRHAGAEVPQLYLEFAPDLREPRLVLRGFRRVRLEPGAAQEVTFHLGERELSVYQPGAGWRPQRVVRAHVGTSSASLAPPVLVRAR